MLHKIDGVLVAVGVIDLLKTILNSDYFFYNPDYSFLHLGTVGAVMEMQYMNLLKS